MNASIMIINFLKSRYTGIGTLDEFYLHQV